VVLRAAKDLPVLYILFVVNAFLAWSEFAFGHTGATMPARVAFSLSYAFAPFFVGLLIAWLMTKHSSNTPPGRGTPFLLNLEMSWSLVLVVAALSHIASITD
jgi:hypothetical protein